MSAPRRVPVRRPIAGPWATEGDTRLPFASTMGGWIEGGGGAGGVAFVRSGSDGGSRSPERSRALLKGAPGPLRRRRGVRQGPCGAHKNECQIPWACRHRNAARGVFARQRRRHNADTNTLWARPVRGWKGRRAEARPWGTHRLSRSRLCRQSLNTRTHITPWGQRGRAAFVVPTTR